MVGRAPLKEGFTVLAPRLPGHATKPDDMQHVHWTDWLAAVEDGLNLLKGCTDQQVVMGLSMGAALSLMAAARYPVAGVVAVSAPYSLGDDWRLPFLRFVQPFMPRYGKGKPDCKIRKQRLTTLITRTIQPGPLPNWLIYWLKCGRIWRQLMFLLYWCTLVRTRACLYRTWNRSPPI